jgi:hypothetical protein
MVWEVTEGIVLGLFLFFVVLPNALVVLCAILGIDLN